MTNYEKIKSMDIDEMADMLVVDIKNLAPCTLYQALPTGKTYLSKPEALQDVKQWLEVRLKNNMPYIDNDKLEYINKEVLIQTLKDNTTEMESDIYYGSNMGIPEDEIENIVNEVSTADVQEIKHGEWIDLF